MIRRSKGREKGRPDMHKNRKEYELLKLKKKY